MLRGRTQSLEVKVEGMSSKIDMLLDALAEAVALGQRVEDACFALQEAARYTECQLGELVSLSSQAVLSTFEKGFKRLTCTALELAAGGNSLFRRLRR